MNDVNVSKQALRLAIFLADQNPHRDRSLGITAMTRSVVDRLKARCDLLLTPIISKSSLSVESLRSASICLPCKTDGKLGRIIADALHPFYARPKADLWYYPKGYLSILAKPSSPVVGTMHDAIVQHYADHYPDSRSANELRYWMCVTRRSLQRFDVVLTVSENAKNQLELFCERHSIKPPKIRVTYEGSSWERYREDRFDKQDYVVHLASTAPHKKTNRLLQMWHVLHQSDLDLPKLRVIGSVDKQGRDVIASMKGVEFAHQVTQEQLVSLVGNALALLLPSEIEGFGLPAIEASYVNTPVCFARGSAVEEVLSAAGSFGAFDLNSVDSFHAALNRCLSISQEKMRELRRSIFERFSTQLCVDRMVREFYSAAGITPMWTGAKSPAA